MFSGKLIAASRIVLIAFSLQGCAGFPQAGPDYAPPDAPSPDHWAESSDRVSAAAPDAQWWRVFNDPVLDRLIADGLAHNHDLAVLRANLLKARALRNKAAGRLQPSVNADADAQLLSRSENGLIPANDLVGLEADTDLYDAGFDAVWEIDLFGGKRRAVEAANARLEASAKNFESAQLSLAAEIARTYVDLIALERRRNAHLAIVAVQDQSKRLVESRLAVGAVKRSDLDRATASLLRAQAAIPLAEAEIRAAAYRLAVLTGASPDQLAGKQGLGSTQGLFDADRIRIGSPAETISARPDVRQAERNLAAETADIGVAKADLLPRLTLMASGGVESIDFSDLFNAASFAGTIGPRLTLPVFGRKSLKAQAEAERAEAEAALAAYRQTILRALEETESAIVRYDRAHDIVNRMESAREFTAKELASAEERFEGGEDDYSAVLESQGALWAIDLELSEAQRSLRVHAVSLMKAVGGAPVRVDTPLIENGV